MNFIKKYILAPQMPSVRNLLATAVGVMAGIGGIAFLAYMTNIPFLIAPFGASAVLIYAAKNSPLAQPRNLIGGHLISGFVAITFCKILGECWVVIPIAVTAAILCMMITGTVHPPGGATALLCAMNCQTSYFFLINPLIVGVAILFVTAFLASRISKDMRWPYRP